MAIDPASRQSECRAKARNGSAESLIIITIIIIINNTSVQSNLAIGHVADM